MVEFGTQRIDNSYAFNVDILCEEAAHAGGEICREMIEALGLTSIDVAKAFG